MTEDMSKTGTFHVILGLNPRLTGVSAERHWPGGGGGGV